MVHILPAAGSASRIGGIPKFLLPIGFDSKPLLLLHTEVALNADLDVVIVTNPMLVDYVSQVIKNLRYENVRVIGFESKSMTDSIVKACASLDDEQIVSVTMPDTYMPKFTKKELFRLREFAPSMSLIKATDDQFAKLGQVKLDREMNVSEIIDKTPERLSQYAWTGFALKAKYLKSFPIAEATPGFQLARIAKSTSTMRAVTIDGEYFDCGTIAEYWQALGKSLVLT
jgi:UTP-glucose-1-phosphate uridylyltransferase